MNALPHGTVTFLFTDVEGSTRLLEELGPSRYAEALAEHRRVLRAAFREHEGVEVDTQGDAFFVAFPTAKGALGAAAAGQAALDGGPVRVRMGIHTGEPLLTAEGYVGMDVHRAARIAAAGHGRQVLVSAATEALAGDAALVDLGPHRLKDLGAAERIYQLGEGTFAPLETLYRTNLPVPATPFVGRAADVAAVVELLGRTDVRLVTITGPGGVGKTRLALQTAAEAAERYPDGITWVPIATVRDPDSVLATIASAVHPDASRREEPHVRLARALRGRRTLLLLDNVEHVVEAVGRLAADLVGGGDTFDLLVTSREPMLVAAEYEYPLAPLDHADAVRLFVERALAVRPDFTSSEAVATLCDRLDRLPLALELAAARTRAISPAALVDRVGERLDLFRGGRDVDPRQHTLRATIEWSHQLLDDNERERFAQLAVFTGGCRIEDAVAVCGTDVVDLAALVEKSLVRLRLDDDGVDRYWMLETIREFAVERLGELPDAEDVRRRHAYRFRERAQESWARLLTGSSAHAEFERLAADEGNLRAALAALRDAGDADALGQLCAALFFHWYFRGDPREGVDWARTALELELDEGLRSELENELAALLLLLGRLDEARALVESAVARARRISDAHRLVFALATLGNVRLASGEACDVVAGRAAYEEALTLCVANGGGWYERGLLFNLALADLQAEDFEAARRRFGRAQSLAADVGDRHLGAATSVGLAWTAVSLGQLAEARAAGATGLVEAHELGMRLDVLSCLHLAAYLDGLDGSAARGGRLLGAFGAVEVETGISAELFGEHDVTLTRAMLRDALGDAAYENAVREGANLSLDDAVALALEALA